MSQLEHNHKSSLKENIEEIPKAKKKYLEEKGAKYNLQPIALGLVSGVCDTETGTPIRNWAKDLSKQINIKETTNYQCIC